MQSVRLLLLMAGAFLVLRHSVARTSGASPLVLYETHFEVAEGFNPDLTLIGQQGWVGEGSGGNGLVTNFFEGEGQHAFIGFGAPTNTTDFLNVWRPVNYRPGTTNPPIVRFSVLMSVEDSSDTVTNRDDFRWSVYNSEGDRLFTLDFDNPALKINYLLDDSEFVSTGRDFTNFVPYRLEIVMDFVANRWSSFLDGTTVTTNLPITTLGLPLNFGDIDAVWAIRVPGKPGDNYMVFDNFVVTAEGANPGELPKLEALGLLRPGEFLVRCFGVAGVRYAVEASADLAGWTPLVTNTVPIHGFFEHLDSSSPPGPKRFYRMVER